jgi:hypothetical protein
LNTTAETDSRFSADELHGRLRGHFLWRTTSMPNISFDGGAFELKDVQENPARYVARLERAKITPGFALCLCVTPPRQLVVRRYGRLLHLAGWPEDGHTHRSSCPFHKDADALKAGGGDNQAAIVASAVGLNAKLDIALTQRDVISGPRQAGKPSGAPRTSRRAAGLLAFLQALWMNAGLTRWSGRTQQRHWGVCNATLLASLGEASQINGNDAQRVLHVMRRYEETERAAINGEFDAFLSTLINGDGKVQRGLIIGEINEVADTQYGKSLSLRQSPKKYFATTALIEHAAKTFSHAWRALGDREARVIALLLVERTPKGHMKLVDLGAMLCSAAFIPCDSIHEVAMANRLTREQREFIKPLRMGGDEEVLTDTSQPVHVEVYGMNGLPAYEARKLEKAAARRRNGIQAVEWNVDREPLDQITLPSPARVTAT